MQSELLEEVLSALKAMSEAASAEGAELVLRAWSVCMRRKSFKALIAVGSLYFTSFSDEGSHVGTRGGHVSFWSKRSLH